MANDERHIYMRLTEYQAGWWTAHIECEVGVWAARVARESNPEDKAEAAHVLAQLSLMLASVQRGVTQLRDNT